MNPQSYQVDIRTTSDGSIDLCYYHAQAQQLRSEHMSAMFKTMVKWVSGLVRIERFSTLDAVYSR